VPSAEPRDETRRGLGFGLLAYFLWGAMPVYFLAMRPAGAVEIVGWRILFSLVFCALLLTVTRAWGPFREVLRDRRTTLLFAVAGALIYVNWTVYVYASTTHQVVDAALGYFINPIVTVLLGVLVLRERLRPGQWVAVGVSALAVIVLGVEAGRLPWISLALAASFGLYGLVKKRARADVVSGLTLETAWLAPVAAVQLAVVGLGPGLAFGTAGLFPSLMLASAGVGTAVPLLLFAASTQRLPLTVAGFLQYVAPILQFLLGVAVLHEAMPPARLAGFVLVWIALALLIGERVLVARRLRRPAVELPLAGEP
jgi:chloramphenicol-sensitive protein RarD